MQNALGLMGDQALMVGITGALGIAGILALLMALFWPRRWKLHYRVEVAFVVLLVALGIFADAKSTDTFRAYEAYLPDAGMVSGKLTPGAVASSFDRTYRVFAFQWGFIFFDDKGRASRNAVMVKPGEKVAFALLSNDVIHGFNIPVARMTTEFEPNEQRWIWIRAPEKPGKYLIQCINYCGLGHSQMKAWLFVQGGEAPAAKKDQG